jgi:hypothetical protein
MAGLCAYRTTGIDAELARLAKNAQSEQARVTAIKEILDRAYGKSKQSVDVNATLSLRDLVLGSYRRE